MRRLKCPMTGTSVEEALLAERAVLQPLPAMGEPFDVVVSRPVSRDGLVSFEGRRYGVPFAWVGREVEVWGLLRDVVIRGAREEIARWPRHTKALLLIDPSHYEGESTERVLRPTPLGTRARLQLLGLSGPSRHTFLHLPQPEREIEWKTERRIATSLKLSGLPTGKTLENFDWTFQPRADRSKLEALATCAYIRQKENVLFLGPPGVGESHLAVALGVKAIKNGFSTTHFALDDLMHVLKADAAIPPARLKARRYFNSGLLIIDEVGFRPLDRHEANLFFRLVSTRYEKGSIILTSNKHVRDWPEIFAGDEVLTTAILDRLLHHVHILHIDGRSYRLREIGELLQGQAAGSSSPPARKGGKQHQISPSGA